MKTSITIAVAAFLLILSAASLHAQDACCGVQPKKSSGKIVTSTAKKWIPFELIRSHIILPVEIKGNKFRMILDTGMPMDGAILFDSPRAKSLGFNDPVRVVASGEGCCGESEDGPAPSMPGSRATLSLPGVDLENQIVAVIEVGSSLGRHLEADGIIGFALFSRFVVEVDHDRMAVALIDPDDFRYSGSGQQLDLPLNSYGVPELKCRTELQNGKTVPLQLVVDTGASHALSLHVGSQEAITLPEGAVESTLGRSLYGDVFGHVGRISSLHLGELELENVVTSFTSDPRKRVTVCGKEGNLGNDALRRFNVIFDYAREKMILEPNSHFKEPFEFNMAGIGCMKTEKGLFKIDRIVPNSPASESGLTVNDLVVDINGKPADQYKVDELRMLLRKEGKNVTLGISRGEERIVVQMKLRRLI
jgi:hypothetical protein